MPEQLTIIDRLDQLAELVRAMDGVYLRYSRGPADDQHKTSRDYESGLELPGLSVVPLTPPDWWCRPAVDWLARQVCKYAKLAEGNPDRCAWLLTGRVVGRGPDQEPLMADPRPRAMLSDRLVEQAKRHYHDRFEVGRDSLG